MKQNIWTIKNILRIIISILVIATMVKSCSMAYTWEDIDEFNSQLLNNENVNSSTKSYINFYNSKKEYVKNYFNNNNLNIDNYEGVTFYRYSSSYTNMFLQTSNTVISKDGYVLKATHCIIIRIRSNNNIEQENDYTVNMWSSSYPYDYWGLTNGSYTGIYENNQYFDNYYTPPSTFNFRFYDESITANVPNGETAYCVFLDPITDNQKIGYIEDFENHKNTKIQIFAQNYRNVDNVLVNSIGEMNYYLNESGELFVNTNTMWSALVYEIVGIDNGPSGDFLNGQNFTAYYYIAARLKCKWRRKLLWC